jgi:hypothetical protein
MENARDHVFAPSAITWSWRCSIMGDIGTITADVAAGYGVLPFSVV